MKKFIMTLILICVIAAGGIAYLNWQKSSMTPPPAVESASSQTTAQPEQIAASKEEQVPVVSQNTNQPAQIPVAVPASSGAKSDNTTNSTALSRAIDVLVSPQTSYAQRQAVLKQLRNSGQIDQAIEALKQGAVNNPASAAYPTALGEAELQKAGLLYINGGNMNEVGALGMQADQSFDAALKLDPSNWEAQFTKAAAMSYWPVSMSGAEVIQRFENLIDQQETMPPQPQFAQTYVLLGQEFQKMGQPDKAEATWQLGLQQFPYNPALQKKISGQ